MATGNVGGQTRQKVELGELIEAMVNEVREADRDEEMSRSQKTQAMKRIATKFKNALYEDGRRRPEAKLKASSYRRYLTRARQAITAQNWRHHSIPKEAERLAKRHPKWADEILALAAIDDVTELRLTHRELVNKMLQAGDDAAHDDLVDMKLDHEVMRHLRLPKATKANLASEHQEVLEHRATNTVRINYWWLMDKVGELLTARRANEEGEYEPFYSYMALALAIVTGRRMWEVLVLGRFKAVGEYEVEFRGQAKKRTGVDYGASYRIYTLLKADQVVEAFETMRALPEVRELQDLDHTEFNRRVAKTLNELTKRTFGSDARTFKDSRAIWARIVFETHFATDPRWRNVNETIFWREQLGHEDMDTQESYKAFKIDYTRPAAEEAPRYPSRIAALRALDEHPEILKREPMARAHEWVKAQVEQEPEAPITQSYMLREKIASRPVIKDYLEIAEEALATPNREILAAAFQPPRAVEAPKPKLVAHRREDGQFEATAKVNGVEVAKVVASDRMAAMREAYEAAVKS